jgi:hypothetical protein
MLKPATCPTSEHHQEVDRTIFGETVQIKKDRTVLSSAVWSAFQ